MGELPSEPLRRNASETSVPAFRPTFSTLQNPNPGTERQPCRQEIAILKAGVVLLPTASSSSSGPTGAKNSYTLTMQAELMRLGFAMDEELYLRVSSLDEAQVIALYDDVIPLLARLVLADKEWSPMYPNFPEQVMAASDGELFWNAITHYWTFGQWRPEYPKNARPPKFEKTKFRQLEAGSETELLRVFTQLLGSNASISDHDRTILKWFVTNYGDELRSHLPKSIPFKEQLCFFAAAILESGDHGLAAEVCKTATDVLRVYTGLSGGDVSLATNTKFKSLPRGQRRTLVAILERVAKPEDLSRNLERWKRAFHSLHVGEFRKTAPCLNEMARQVREGKIRTFAGMVESALANRDIESLVKLLGSRPGELARRLDHLLRTFPCDRGTDLIRIFLERAPQVSSRLLLQLLTHFRTRGTPTERRVVFPKGNVGKSRILLKQLPALPASHVEALCSGIEKVLRDLYATREPLGKVWIDPYLKKCPVPLSLRSASEGLVTVARGTRMPISDKSTLRMFVWWIGRDVDLSCTLYDKDLQELDHISYTNLRIKGINCCHSGDITNAPGPKGAAEFIDIDIESARARKVRYIALVALDFTGVTFEKIEACHVGWMTRDHPDANEIYDPKTVEQKIDLRSPTRVAVPAVFDLEKREAIWLDLTAKSGNTRNNNVESNSATLVDLITAALSLEDKPNLHSLFTLHAQTRGELVEEREQADTVFAFDTGITPFHTAKILSDFI